MKHVGILFSTLRCRRWLYLGIAFVSFDAAISAQDAATVVDRPDVPSDIKLPAVSWVKVTGEAAFSPRDTAEDLVYQGKMWISNPYYHGNKLTRDLWNSSDGKTWTLVNDSTAYDGYSELAVYKDKMWAVKGSVWTSTDGKTWERVLEKTPFGKCGYGEVVVFKGKMWHLGSGPGVWNL